MGKGTTTRQTILDQGVALASVHGLGGVSIGALAEGLGKSRNTAAKTLADNRSPKDATASVPRAVSSPSMAMLR